MFSKALKTNQNPEVQSVAATALCKLLLVNVVHDGDLLKQTVVSFFDHETNGNAGLKQALSYSIPVYCYSKRENMEQMAQISGDIIRTIIDMSDELGDEEEMIGVSKVGSLLVDWTDARKLVNLDDVASSFGTTLDNAPKAIDADPHLTLAQGILHHSLSHRCSSKSPFCSSDLRDADIMCQKRIGKPCSVFSASFISRPARHKRS